MTGFNFINLHIGDFLGDVMDMDAEQIGAYMMLLIAHYKAGETGIANDDEKLARISRVSLKSWNRIKPCILERFTVTGDFLTQSRVIEELRKGKSKSSDARAKALKRWKGDDATACAKALPQQCNPTSSIQYPLMNDDEARAKISDLTGWANDPNWMGNFSRLKAWHEAGFDLELDVIPTIARVMSKKTTGPPSSLNYFDRAIADAHATRTKPLPEGKAHATHNPRKSATDAHFDGFAQAARLGQGKRTDW